MHQTYNRQAKDTKFYSEDSHEQKAPENCETTKTDSEQQFLCPDKHAKANRTPDIPLLLQKFIETA